MLGHTSVRKPINDSAIYFLIGTVFFAKKNIFNFLPYFDKTFAVTSNDDVLSYFHHGIDNGKL